MALYVRDEGVNRLASQAKKALGTSTKTEAIRIALQRVLEHDKAKPSLRERLLAVQRDTLALGTPDPDFDEKAFSDSMWGGD